MREQEQDIAERSAPEDAAHPLRPVLRPLGALRVPQGSKGLWQSFGWLTLFLLGTMIATGILLAIYYEPSAAPAVTPDGKPMLTARVRAGTTLEHYPPGAVIPLPYDPATGEILAGPRVRQGVDVLLNVYTSTPIRPSAAWVSVEERIMREVELGPVIRSIHTYAAGMLFAALFIHLASALAMRAYRRPRRLTWWTGVTLLLLVTGSGFTGSVLPWNTLSVSAARVAASYPEQSIPLAGSWIGSIARGGAAVAGATLTRMFALHAVILPLAILAVLGFHLLMVHATGLASGAERNRGKGLSTAIALAAGSAALLILYPILTGEFAPSSPYIIVPLTVLPIALARIFATMIAGSLRDISAGAAPQPGKQPLTLPFYGEGLAREVLAWTLLLGALGTLAAVLPHVIAGEAGLPVDITRPMITPRAAHPEWYLMVPYQLLRVLPGGVAMAVIAAGTMLLAAMPEIDRGPRRSGAATAVAVLLIAGAAGLMLWGYATS